MVNKGFTLIELMIVVAIIAVLVAIAYPSYTQYRVKTNRAQAQSELLVIAQEMNSYKGVNGSFENASLLNIYGATAIPKEAAIYDLGFQGGAPGATQWILIAKPKVTSIQKNDGWLCLNHQGQRLWVKGGTSCNDLSHVSTWN
jgi:type IV pilus assembly protein PilE